MDYFSGKLPFFRKWFKIKETLYKEAIESDITKCTCQFFIDTVKNNSPSAHGSGVFIEYNDAKYLVTAAHVLEGYHENIYITADTDGFRLGGEIFISKLPPNCKKRDDDPFDIGVIKLCQKTLETLARYKFQFVKQNRLDVSHKAEENQIYLTFGFPATKTKIKYKDTIEALVLETRAITNKKTFKRNNLDPVVNMIAVYNRSQLFTSKNPINHTGPKPHGISGSGLWCVKSMKQEEGKTIPTTLAGILTTWESSDSIIIGTHIAAVLKFIDDETT